MSEHTPGPWFFLGSLVTDDAVIVSNEGQEVLGVSEWVRAEDADLRLMTAAPDLLGTLEMCASILNDDGVFTEQEKHLIDLALSKAKGPWNHVAHFSTDEGFA